MYKCHMCQNDIKTDGIHHVLWRNSKEPLVLCTIKCVRNIMQDPSKLLDGSP